MIAVFVKMIVIEHMLVHKLLLHVATHNCSPEGMLLADYTKFLLVKLVQ